MFRDFDEKIAPEAPRGDSGALRGAPGAAPGRASARFWRGPKTDLGRDPVLVPKRDPPTGWLMLAF